MIKCVLFDLDGTLIQTTEIIIETFKVTFQKYFPHIQLSDDDYTNMLGQTLFTTFGYYTSNQDEINEVVQFYRTYSDDIIEQGLKSYPGAVEIMTFLKKKNVKIGVVTSKMRHVATHHLKLTGLVDFIDGLVGYEDVTEHKPSPEPILKALQLFGTKPQSTIYIGDHENDIISAKKAGILTCAVTYSQRLKEMLSYNPDYAIDELMHIKDII
ncbi:MAG TPA: HAD-IA family hydrolase [Acholeplasmataceae bacterium]|nr:HAD-IA family hydrolase [Acholeplasmataceae bacterium]